MARAPGDRRGDADVAATRSGEVDAIAACAGDVHGRRRADRRRGHGTAVDGVTARAGDVKTLDVNAAG